MSARPASAQRRPGRPRGPSRAEAHRERIVAEASRLYAEGGYHGLSYGVLAERTGFTKATLFHYFPNKDSLVDAIFGSLEAELDRRAATWFEPPPTSFAARLERIADALVDFYAAEPVHARVLCQGLMQPPARRPETPRFGSFVSGFLSFLEAGIRAGEFHPDRPLGTLMSLGGAILFEAMIPRGGAEIDPRGGVTLEQRKGEIRAFLRRAIVRPVRRGRGKRT